MLSTAKCLTRVKVLVGTNSAHYQLFSAKSLASFGSQRTRMKEAAKKQSIPNQFLRDTNKELFYTL